MSFAALLENFGNQVALQFEDQTQITYSELAKTSDHIFTDKEAPSTPRTLIAIECKNTLTSIAGYVGALRHNFPAILIDEKIDHTLRNRLYQHYQISHIWCTSGTWLKTKYLSPFVHPDTAIMLSTSGSTGAPKLVRLTQKNLQANADSICEYLNITAAERPITTLPIYYSYGLSVLNSHLNIGAKILVTEAPISTRSFWDFFRNYQATSFAGVPTHYAMLKQMRFERMDLPSLQTMTQAGGGLALDVIKFFAELCAAKGRQFFIMYGQTEATARISYLPPERLAEKIGSIGIPIPQGKLHLINKNGCEVNEPNVNGELCYSGSNVMMGYAECIEDLALPDSMNGVLRTGDLAYKDKDNFYHIVGRLARFIKISGNRISLDEIERQLKKEKYNALVTGKDDRLVIALLKNEAASDIEITLRAHITSLYHFHHSAIRIIFVDSFPLSSTGKIKYAELLEMALSSN